MSLTRITLNELLFLLCYSLAPILNHFLGKDFPLSKYGATATIRYLILFKAQLFHPTYTTIPLSTVPIRKIVCRNNFFPR